MSSGRPQKSRLLPDNRNGTWHEVLILGPDDRLRVSADVTRRRPWLEPGNEVLATLCPECAVRLTPFSNAKAVENQLRLLATKELDGNEAVELAIRRRYLRLRVNSDYRMLLPKDVRLCLGLDPVAHSYVILTVLRTVVELRPGERTIYEIAENALDESSLE